MKGLKEVKLVNRESDLSKDAIDFINAGLGCNCLVALHRLGIVDRLLSNEWLKCEEIDKDENRICINSALLTLQKCQIVKKENQAFKLTQLGIELSKYIGVISMMFDGYSDLVTSQDNIAPQKPRFPEKLIKGQIVSKSAIELAKTMFELILIRELSKLKFSGTICDVSYTYTQMLPLICEVTGNPGLGFAHGEKIVRHTKNPLNKIPITIEKMNVTRLQGIWEDVTVLIQCHVFHNFAPQEEQFVQLMNSFLNHFPHLKYLFFLDSVAAYDNKNEVMPGFDYVHGLLGIKVRTYQETIAMFNASDYHMVKEMEIEPLPNTFLWILTPKKK